MQSCLALRFLVKREIGGAHGRLMNIYFLSNISPRLACMRTSRKTDFRYNKDFPSSKNNFRGHDISQWLDREPPSLSPHFLLMLTSFGAPITKKTNRYLRYVTTNFQSCKLLSLSCLPFYISKTMVALGYSLVMINSRELKLKH